MNNPGMRNLLAGGLLSLSCATGFQVRAGGSGLNTVVIVNQNSAQSCELGNYFCERRQVPPAECAAHQLGRGQYLLEQRGFPGHSAHPAAGHAGVRAS